jgi:hypothetical protein
MAGKNADLHGSAEATLKQMAKVLKADVRVSEELDLSAIRP